MKFDPVEFERLRMAGQPAALSRARIGRPPSSLYLPRELCFDDLLLAGLAAAPIFCAIFF